MKTGNIFFIRWFWLPQETRQNLILGKKLYFPPWGRKRGKGKEKGGKRRKKKVFFVC